MSTGESFTTPPQQSLIEHGCHNCGNCETAHQPADKKNPEEYFLRGASGCLHPGKPLEYGIARDSNGCPSWVPEGNGSRRNRYRQWELYRLLFESAGLDRLSRQQLSEMTKNN